MSTALQKELLGKSKYSMSNLGTEDLVGLSRRISNLESGYHDKMKLPYTREGMYELYDQICELPEASGVLAGAAEDACQTDQEFGVPIWITSKNSKLQANLMELLHTQLKIEDWLTSLAGDVAKYGDEFGRIGAKPKEGVRAIEDWPYPSRVTRLETMDAVCVGFIDDEKFDKANTAKMTAGSADLKDIDKPWDFVHFRIRAQNRMPYNRDRWIYGTSLLFPVRRTGRRLLLFSDVIFLYRLRNSFDRRVFYIDVGNEDMVQAIKILKKWRRALEKKQFVSFSSDQFRTTTDPWALGEALFWPKRTNSQSAVDTIAGNPNVSEMADLDHEMNEFFAGVNAPKEFFGFGREGGMFDRDKALTHKDMRWGRSVNRVQRPIIVGVKRICDIHLAHLDIDPRDSKNEFKVNMVPPSVLEAMQQMEYLEQRAGLASSFYSVGETLQLNLEIWKVITLNKFFNFTKKQVDALINQDATKEEQEQFYATILPSYAGLDVLPGTKSLDEKQVKKALETLHKSLEARTAPVPEED